MSEPAGALGCREGADLSPILHAPKPHLVRRGTWGVGRRDGQSGPWLELSSSSRVPPFLPRGTLGPLPLPVGAQGCLRPEQEN